MWCRPSLLKSRCPLQKQNKILFRNAMTTLIECFKICFFHLFFCWFKMFFATSLVCSRVVLSAKCLENLNLCNSRANHYQNINSTLIMDFGHSVVRKCSIMFLTFSVNYSTILFIISYKFFLSCSWKGKQNSYWSKSLPVESIDWKSQTHNWRNCFESS